MKYKGVKLLSMLVLTIKKELTKALLTVWWCCCCVQTVGRRMSLIPSPSLIDRSVMVLASKHRPKKPSLLMGRIRGLIVSPQMSLNSVAVVDDVRPVLRTAKIFSAILYGHHDQGKKMPMTMAEMKDNPSSSDRYSYWRRLHSNDNK
jgi:hypothetical protein